MTERMLKYRISAEQEQTTVAMRVGAVIRAVGIQRPGEICLWAEVPDAVPVETRTFRIIGTGFEVPDDAGIVYVGTAFDDPFVWHVYEVAP